MMRIRFGSYTVDLDTRELLRVDGQAAHLSGKAFQLLELLIKNRPRAISKPELQAALWPKTFVVESNLADLVSEIRHAIGQAGQRSGFIRTVHGFGYAFSGPAEEDKPSALCRLVWEGGQVVLGAGEFVLGRDPKAAAQIETSTVSWNHARIQATGWPGNAKVTIADLESRNGTFINGRKLDAPTELHDGDRVRLGSTSITVRMTEVAKRETDPIADSDAD